jgi:hypothetical protein
MNDYKALKVNKTAWEKKKLQQKTAGVQTTGHVGTTVSSCKIRNMQCSK